MMHIKFVISIVTLFSFIQQAWSFPEQILTQLNQIVEANFMEEKEIVGLGLAIVTPNESLAIGYGLMDLDNQKPTTNRTLFQIASISKTFTAVVVANKLSQVFPELGESALDVPIRTLAPRYNFTLGDRYRSESTSFRDLLSHRICLDSYGIPVTVGAFKTREERIYRNRYLDNICPFRSTYVYNNNMFILAGDVLAFIVGRPFDDMVQSLLDAIGMSDTIIMNETDDYETMELMSRGYYFGQDKELLKMSAKLYNGNSGAAAGGIISSANDMEKYIRFQLGHGSIDGQQVVPKAVMDWLYKPTTAIPYLGLDSGVEINEYAYGIGHFLGISDGGFQRISHHGELLPFTGLLSLYPQHKIGFFVATNGAGMYGTVYSAYRDLHEQILNLLLNGNMQQNEFNSKTVRSNSDILSTRQRIGIPNKRSQQSGTSPKKSIDYAEDDSNKVGLFGHPYQGVFEVTIEEASSKLMLKYGSRGTAYLTNEGENIYSIEWFGDIVELLYAESYDGNLPEMKMQYGSDSDTWDLILYGNPGVQFQRNATLETFPTIPWNPDSCGPSKLRFEN